MKARVSIVVACVLGLFTPGCSCGIIPQRPDGGPADASVARDAGGEDAGRDAGATDSALLDSGAIDASTLDAGATDAAGVDTGVTDAGVADAAADDAGLVDAAGLDAGLPDVIDAGGCLVGQTRPCYTGPEGTQFFPPCMEGTESCGADAGWSGVCDGEVLPMTEIADTDLDENCNGSPSN